MINTLNSIRSNYANYNKVSQNSDVSKVEESFRDKIQTVSKNGTSSNETNAKNDMIIKQPPIYTSTTYDATISSKSKKEMTIDEYKQYFTNEMSKIPVSSYYQNSFTGSLVITNECFERMKEDPEWEKTVLNMLREMYSVNGLPQKSYGMQVIGASPEECYGYSVPIESSGGAKARSGNMKSWWQERQEKMEEAMEEEMKERIKEKMEQVKRLEQEYEKQLFLNQSRVNLSL
ncbi:DUF6033 family protein [Candidatus Galacturonibacter soehngenii]|uniref:DUF6033 family protein n=1 Tax=Candidatus Galacturonatibacter soehngenii TaxID=2307010 RepID=UPI00178285B8|nr:DUF6033 family protein [Candidatus Galacturonibacter soehngenii]